MPDTTSFTATVRTRRAMPETPPVPRPRRSRALLVGLPVFAVFAAFGAIVWLAYEHGSDGPPVGEPPLIKAPTTALKLPPDEAGAPPVADQGEVRDLLAGTPPGDHQERLLPSPEQPLSPNGTAPTSSGTNAGVPAATPPAPAQTAAVEQTPPAQPAPPSQAASLAARPTPSPAEAASPPVQATPPAAQAASPPATPAPRPTTEAASPSTEAPLPPAEPASPTKTTPAPGGNAVAAAGPPRSPAVEAQSTSQSGVNQSSTATQQSPKEAEAALNALLADVTNSTNPPQPTAPAPGAVTPPESAPVEPQAPVIAAAKPAPSTQPAGQVTANTPSQPRPKPSARGAGAAPTAALAPKLEQAPNGSVAAADGAYRIQLAAVRDEADARRAWDLFMADLGPVLRGVQPFIERADTANGTFYRVQIGPFANQQDAETLCDELKRRNASCFVIRH